MLGTRHRLVETGFDARFDPRFDIAGLRHAGTRYCVLSAHDTTLARPVSLKFSRDPGARWLNGALREQASMLASAGAHPNVLTVFEITALTDGRPVLVLEHCAGSLAQSLAGGARLPAPTVATLGIRIATGLDVLHRRGIVHCDVRPATVLIGEWGHPVLAGFDEAVRPATGARPALHAPSSYTAPELLQGAPASPRSDVYGLAATLYALLAGHGAVRAHAGESAAEIVVRVLGGQVRPILTPDVPLAMSDLLTWALAGDPARRPPSPSWLAEELARIRSAEGWPTTPA